MEGENTQMPTDVSAPTQAQVDPFADSVSEEDIGRMFDQPEAQPASAETQPGNDNADQPAATPEEGEPATEEKPTEPAREEVPGDDDLILPLATGETKLTGNEVCDYVELGMAAKQHGQRIQEAFAFQERLTPLVNALQNDPGLVAYLQAYGQQEQVAPHQPNPYAGNDEVAAFEQHILQKAAEMLIPRITQQVEEKYKPFVQNVEGFTARAMAEKAKAIHDSLRADPDYDAINSEVYASVGNAVSKGTMTAQEAATTYQALQNDPSLYERVYKHMKTKRGGEKSPAASPAGVQQVRKVVRAPKLEAQGVVSASADRIGKLLKQARDTGDPEDVGKLFG